MMKNQLTNITGFEWDEGNINKNKEKHGLDWWLIEEIFFYEPVIIQDDIRHSGEEKRWFLLGKTDNAVLIMAVFTVRNQKIRIISARKMNKKERKAYEKA
ncbi:MAG: BrnT family toxin [Bacteroidetes bacterium]|nr:BrnT family toxin [Bacteroidota bacterium]